MPQLLRARTLHDHPITQLLSQLLPSEALPFHHHLQTSPAAAAAAAALPFLLSLSLSLSSARPLFRHFKTLSILPSQGDCERCQRLRDIRLGNSRNGSRRPSLDLLTPSPSPRLASPAAAAAAASAAAFAASLSPLLAVVAVVAAAAAVGRFVSSFLKWAARIGDFILWLNS